MTHLVDLSDEYLIILQRAKDKNLLHQYVVVKPLTSDVGERHAMLYGFHVEEHGTLCAVVSGTNEVLCELVHYSRVKGLTV